jgi:hypothetical protein
MFDSIGCLKLHENYIYKWLPLPKQNFHVVKFRVAE